MRFCRFEAGQPGRLREMIFPLDAIIRFIALVMTLEPGDVVARATPAGSAALRVGNVVEGVIEEVGRLRNPVARAQER